ncbi:MAG: hypothetical protein ACRDPC_04895 [Solirubrobacteraceae bacterium]
MRIMPFALGCAFAAGLVAIVQVANLDGLMDVTEPLTAGFAKALVLGYGLAAVGIAGLAALLPERRLWLPVAGAAALTGVALAATLLVGGELWSLACALLTMTACWQVGRWVLAAARMPSLAQLAPAAWLAGIGTVGLVLLAVGRAGLLTWWTAGIPILAIGLLGAVRLTGALGGSGARAVWSAVSSTRLAAASAALCVLTLGLASVWTAAPELAYDALAYKAWLPAEWARTGGIAPLTLHPLLNFLGFTQIVATPGHLVGAEGVGRYIQWLALAAVAASIWWGARRSPWAPVAAMAVVLTPQMLWQATTAYDDAVLALAGVAFALAVLRLLSEPEAPPFWAGAALGLLAASCFGLKIHLMPIAAGLLIGWLLMRRRAGTGAALGGVLVGGLAFSLPPLILRWIDTGNPLMPSYNAIFESPYLPAQNFDFGFPRLADPGALGPITTLWTTIGEPGTIDSFAPVGALGLLSVAVAVALLTAWRRGPGDRAVMAVWMGLLLGAASWYLQFRNTRYLLPAGALAVLVIALALGVRSPGRRLEWAGLAGIAVTAVLLWPSTVAQFFNVPGRDIPWEVAIGRIADRDYENRSTPAREAVAAFDRLAPPGALAGGDPHQRAWLTQGRDFTPFWEIELRLRIGEPLPSEPAETLRRVRAAGVEWMLVYQTGTLPRLPWLEEMVQVHGEEVWSSPVATLYRLSGP